MAAEALSDLHQRYRDRFDDCPSRRDQHQGGRPGPGFSRHLLRALPEGDATEQAAICFVLGVIQDPSTTSALTSLLDGPPVVAAAAAAALGGLAHQAGDHVLAGIRTGSPSHRKALLPHISGGWAAADVVTCLRDEDPDVRVLACEALARMGAVGQVAALFPVLGDPDTRVSYAAVGAIQSLGSTETERLALEAARSPDVRVRRAALRILTYFGSTKRAGRLPVGAGGSRRARPGEPPSRRCPSWTTRARSRRCWPAPRAAPRRPARPPCAAWASRWATCAPAPI